MNLKKFLTRRKQSVVLDEGKPEQPLAEDVAEVPEEIEELDRNEIYYEYAHGATVNDLSVKYDITSNELLKIIQELEAEKGE